jgi:hypothetical protein
MQQQSVISLVTTGEGRRTTSLVHYAGRPETPIRYLLRPPSQFSSVSMLEML